MAFLGPDDILVTEKETGIVKRILNGQISLSSWENWEPELKISALISNNCLEDYFLYHFDQMSITLIKWVVEYNINQKSESIFI
jgi:hypothetical protein